jgi:lysozyme
MPSVDFNKEDYKSKYPYSKVLEEVIQDIKSKEGFVDTMYICPAGYKTIGYGHRVFNDTLRKVNETQAEILLKRDFGKALKYAKLDKVDSRYELAVAHFIYCLGVGNYQKSTFRKYLKIGELDSACLELRKWNKINGREFENLTKQREFEINIIKKSKYYKNEHF